MFRLIFFAKDSSKKEINVIWRLIIGPDGIIHHCDLCDFSTTIPRSLRRHIESKHENTRRHRCDQCGYAALKASGLKVHIESVHEGIRYPCDQCAYSATTAGSLKNHVQARHEALNFLCDKCDFVAGKQTSLKFHIESKHEEIRKKSLVKNIRESCYKLWSNYVLFDILVPHREIIIERKYTRFTNYCTYKKNIPFLQLK